MTRMEYKIDEKRMRTRKRKKSVCIYMCVDVFVCVCVCQPCFIRFIAMNMHRNVFVIDIYNSQVVAASLTQINPNSLAQYLYGHMIKLRTVSYLSVTVAYLKATFERYSHGFKLSIPSG